MKKSFSNLFIFFFLAVACVSFSFPFLYNCFYDLNSTYVVIDYEARERANAQFFRKVRNRDNYLALSGEQMPVFSVKNTTISKKTISEKIKDGDMIGYIAIPKINLVLPIYEGTSDYVLQNGIGHVRYTQKASRFPILGKNKNCVLAGHSGLSARLFSDLDKLKVGDVFYIRIRDRYYEYKVRECSVKTPAAADKMIQIEKGKDICTLVTCTPVPLNSHRLLVKGERTKYDKLFSSDALKQRQFNISILSVMLSCVFILTVLSIQIIYRKGLKHE